MALDLAALRAQAQAATAPAPVALSRGLGDLPEVKVPGVRELAALPALTLGKLPEVKVTGFSTDKFLDGVRDAVQDRVIQGAANAANMPQDIGAWQRVGVLAGGITVGAAMVLVGISIAAR